MPSNRLSVCSCVFALLIASVPLFGVDRVFVLPSGTSGMVTVLDAADLSFQASIPASFASFKVLGVPAGNRYYILSSSPTEAITVVDSTTLSIQRTINLENGVSDGIVAPDGQHLLLAARQFRVLRLGAEETIVAELDLGGSVEQIIVSHVLNVAYVLAAGGNTLSVVDLETFEVIETLAISGGRGMTLSASEDRILVITEDRLQQFRTSDYSQIDTALTTTPVRSGSELQLVPGSPLVVIRNGGSSPSFESQIIDLDTLDVKEIDTAGASGLRQVLPLNKDNVLAATSGQDIVRINLEDTPRASLSPLNPDLKGRYLGGSPNDEFLYVASASDSVVRLVEVATGEIVTEAPVAVAPGGLSVVFEPSAATPAAVTISGGNNQFVPPGTVAAKVLSVTVTDSDGSPLFGVPVLFSVREATEIEFLPAPIVTTNTQGIASVSVRIPEPSATPEAATGEAIPSSLDLSAGSSVEGVPVQPVAISASVPGGHSANFFLNIVQGTGVIKISGDFQVTEPRDFFPDPFVVLVTDESGRPLPQETLVAITPSGVFCLDNQVLVDISGFASVTCRGGDLIPGAGPFRIGFVSIRVVDHPELETALFDVTSAIGARQVFLEKGAGDGQKAPTGSALPTPLTMTVRTQGTTLGPNGVGIQLRPKSGPPVNLNPRFAVGQVNLPVPVSVTLGAQSGVSVIEAVASAPGHPSVEFTVEAAGGAPVRFEKEGDGQSIRIGRFLMQPLRVRVFNQAGQIIPFPSSQWTVPSGQATLLTTSDVDGAVAYVQMGLTPGLVVVQAQMQGLVATFNVTAIPPNIIAVRQVSGDEQTVQVGDTSEPLVVEVFEVGDLPAVGGVVTFSAPPNILFHPIGGGEPSNPFQMTADQGGLAAVRAEVLGILPGEGDSTEPGPPAQAASAVPITVTTSGQATTTFFLHPLGRTPVFDESPVLNAATFVPGLVPGSLAALFGSGLSEGVTGTVEAGGALSFNGVSVQIGGIPAPLLTITRDEEGGMEQINFQVPFQVSPGQLTTLQVENNGSVASVEGVAVFSSQPGVFEVLGVEPNPIGAVVHTSNFSLVTSSNPAARGESVAAFFTGGGILNPPVATGVLGPADPPALMALPVVVNVGGTPATVDFQGYAPSLLGVYQVNFAIPETAECGTRPLSLTVGGADSPATTIAVQCP